MAARGGVLHWLNHRRSCFSTTSWFYDIIEGGCRVCCGDIPSVKPARQGDFSFNSGSDINIGGLITYKSYESSELLGV